MDITHDLSDNAESNYANNLGSVTTQPSHFIVKLSNIQITQLLLYLTKSVPALQLADQKPEIHPLPVLLHIESYTG